MPLDHSDNSNASDPHQATPEFVRLLTACQNQIYAYIMSLVGNCNDADDILQETTTTMWCKFAEFKPGTDFLAWGKAIAWYKVHEFRNKKRGRFQFDDKIIELLHEKSSHELADTNIYLEKLQECLRKLSQSDFQLIRLRYSSGVSMKELSNRMNKTVRNIYYRLAKIQGDLLNCIEKAVLREDRS